MEALKTACAPHALLKGSTPQLMHPTRRQLFQAGITRDVNSAMSALAYVSI